MNRQFTDTRSTIVLIVGVVAAALLFWFEGGVFGQGQESIQPIDVPIQNQASLAMESLDNRLAALQQDAQPQRQAIESQPVAQWAQAEAAPRTIAPDVLPILEYEEPYTGYLFRREGMDIIEYHSGSEYWRAPVMAQAMTVRCEKVDQATLNYNMPEDISGTIAWEMLYAHERLQYCGWAS